MVAACCAKIEHTVLEMGDSHSRYFNVETVKLETKYDAEIFTDNGVENWLDGY